MRSLILTSCIAALLLPAFVANASLSSEPDSEVTDKLAVPKAGKMSVAEVGAMLERREAIFVFDANERESYLKGHVPGAQWIQYDAVSAAKLPKSKDARLLFYCYNPLCGASPLAAKKAVSLGYRNVWLMPEGITGWRKANLPVVAGTNAR